MSAEIDLKETERETRVALHHDGLDEILVGFSLGIMAVFFLDFRLSIALIAGLLIPIGIIRLSLFLRKHHKQLPEVCGGKE